MSEHPTYKIKTVSDFLKVPADRRAVCLAEFAVWLPLAENAMRLLDGIKVEWPDHFVWIDDDLHTAEISISNGDEKITVASGRMAAFA